MNVLFLSAVWGVMMMFTGFLVKCKTKVRYIALTGMLLLVAASVADFAGFSVFNIKAPHMLFFDRFSLLFMIIVTATVLIYFLLSSRDMEKVGNYYSEYFALIFFVICGMGLISSFQSLLILFLGIEIISIPLYILAGTEKKNLKSNEAALKYFLMGAFSTGIMLLGITFLYGATGTFSTVFKLGPDTPPSALMIVGMLLLFFSMAFKASLVPFHFWTPDVYDGTPSVFTSFMATIVKAAVFIAFLKLFEESFGALHTKWQWIAAVITAATLIVGNITAVFQQSVKRMLAYSSIAQAGFMMLAVFALNTDGKEGLLLYAVAYSLATIGIFAVLAKMNDYTYSGFNGLARYEPLIAFSVTVFLLSLAGIPLTAGFLSKFYMLKAAMINGSGLWLIILAILMACVSIYYYFRVIQAMYFKEPELPQFSAHPSFRLGLIAVSALLILFGIFPNWILNWLYF
ncbi:MAG: NADH-quinone oxidoreductase subunit N [Chitinophagaceae bacterium]|nr:NADH-quinone oxidoreductase subunit N [Chitinophagaceae bacterium]